MGEWDLTAEGRTDNQEGISVLKLVGRKGGTRYQLVINGNSGAWRQANICKVKSFAKGTHVWERDRNSIELDLHHKLVSRHSVSQRCEVMAHLW